MNTQVSILSIAEGLHSVSALINEQRSFVITTHLNPDADAIGSACALMLALRNLGKEAVVINASPTPDYLQFLPGASDIQHYRAEIHDEMLLNTNVVLCLDLNVLARTGDMQLVLQRRIHNMVMIDHHADPFAFYSHDIHDVNATSTAELIYKLLANSFESSIDAGVAENLYAGIMSDTGNFRFPRVCAETHYIVAALIEHGADPVRIYDTMYNSWSMDKTRLMGEALAGMKLYYDGRFCLMTVTREMYTRHNCKEDSLESAVQQTLTILGVQCGALVAEKDQEGEIKISLRSKGDFFVNEIAASFGGGGHVYAAGARAKSTNITDVVSQLLERVGAKFGIRDNAGVASE